MPFRWDYPVAVLAHGGGYASIVEDDDDDSRHSLIVLTDTDKSADMMVRLGIMGAPRLLQNAREFRWLVESLQHPVTHVAFDIDPEGSEPNPQISLSIAELLADHLVVDYSPWNYPVFVIAVDDGFVSITGARNDGSSFHAIAAFRGKERVEAYIEATGEGELCELRNVQEAIKFFTAMADQVDAVALDPTMEDGQCVTKHCFAIDVLLDKYLVEEHQQEGTESGDGLTELNRNLEASSDAPDDDAL